MSTALLPPVWQLAQSGRFDEFAAAYQPGDAALVWEDGQTLLHRSLINGDLPARIAISSFLLDEGANAAALSGTAPEQNTTLHALLGRTLHDVPLEAVILNRLLDGGADLNRFSGRFRTPLFTIARQFKFSDATLTPFYDQLFARPHLNLRSTAPDGRSTADSILLFSDRARSALKARVTAHLEAHG
jgi:hypothetical protein